MTLPRLLLAALLSACPVAAAQADHQAASSPTVAPPPQASLAGITRPVPLGVHSVAAFYPDEARRLGQQGDVIVRFVVRTDGSVSDVAVESSSGFPLLDTAAVTAVATWRYMPAMQGGTPVEFHDRALLRFRFRDTGVTVPPMVFNIIQAPGEAYPPDAIANRQQGATQIEVLVDENGNIGGAQVAATSGSQSLDDAAMRLARQWHIKAATIDGTPMKSVIELIINWTLPPPPPNTPHDKPI